MNFRLRYGSQPAAMTLTQATALFVFAVALSAQGCGGSSGSTGASGSTPVSTVPNALSTPTPTADGAPAGNERYVTVGFWTASTCSGAPVSTNAFPVHFGDTQCYSWPGRSGENSAARFSCGANSFSYTQWTTLTCSGGQNPQGTRKTNTLTDCTQDVPPTLYSRIVDFSGCAGSQR